MNYGDLDAPRTTSARDERRRSILLAAMFGAVALLAGVDLVTDVREGASFSHWVLETLLLLFGLFGLAAMVRGLLRTAGRAARLAAQSHALAGRLEAKDDETRVLNKELAVQTAEAERWREEARTALQGLGEAIDRQFERWHLTAAEKEVALLLLKGLSHKEIAQIRGTSDATSRQQARSAYRKAGLTGRNDLSAFFLEDLLLPVTQRD